VKGTPTPKGLSKAVRPLQGRMSLYALLSVGFTHGYSHRSPAGSKAGTTQDARLRAFADS